MKVLHHCNFTIRISLYHILLISTKYIIFFCTVLLHVNIVLRTLMSLPAVHFDHIEICYKIMGCIIRTAQCSLVRV